MSNGVEVVPLGLYTVGRDPMSFAQGVRAGEFIFLNGISAVHGNPPDASLFGEPRALLEADEVWHRTEELLSEGDSDIDLLLRCDQFFTGWHGVPFFHQVRRERCGVSPPSTSLLVNGLVRPCTLMMDAIAACHSDLQPQRVFPEELDIPATSGFAPVIKYGDWAFVAGFMAAHGSGDLGGIAPEAKVPEGHLWKGNRIELETNYLIKNKLLPALDATGMSLAQVRKATVALSDLADLPAFNQVWNRAFSGTPPATTIIPVSSPGFAIQDARIEINLVAHGGGECSRLLPEHRHRGALAPGYPVAVRIGDFLAFSAILAPQLPELPEARPHNFLRSDIDDQMAWILDALSAYCDAHGARLKDVVRIMHLHTDLRDFAPSCRAWQRRLPETALPIAALKVPRLPDPNAVVQVEVWVYAPQ